MSGFRRHFGFSFRDNFDLFTEHRLNDQDGTGLIDEMSDMGSLLLTCSRVDGKFTDAVKVVPGAAASSRDESGSRSVAAQPVK
jgi:hypothetical protein